MCNLPWIIHISFSCKIYFYLARNGISWSSFCLLAYTWVVPGTTMGWLILWHAPRRLCQTKELCFSKFLILKYANSDVIQTKIFRHLQLLQMYFSILSEKQQEQRPNSIEIYDWKYLMCCSMTVNRHVTLRSSWMCIYCCIIAFFPKVQF